MSLIFINHPESALAVGQHGDGIELVGKDPLLHQLSLALESNIEISDTKLHPDLNTATTVIGPPYIRSCAGIVLKNKQGRTIGSFWLLDIKAGSLVSRWQDPLMLLAIHIQEKIITDTNVADLKIFEKLFFQSEELICVAGTDGFFRRVSTSFRKLLGWSDHQMFEISYFDLIHPAKRQGPLHQQKYE